MPGTANVRLNCGPEVLRALSSAKPWIWPTPSRKLTTRLVRRENFPFCLKNRVFQQNWRKPDFRCDCEQRDPESGERTLNFHLMKGGLHVDDSPTLWEQGWSRPRACAKRISMTSMAGSMGPPVAENAQQDDEMRIIQSSDKVGLTKLKDEVALPRDVYFSADIETDGAIPGPNSILSIGITYAGAFDGQNFFAPADYKENFYRELKPISDEFDPKALEVNGFDRDRLKVEGTDPEQAMSQAAEWITKVAGDGDPILVAYPLSFDWSWLYWYFVRFSKTGSPFGYSRCFDIKTAIAVKHSRTIASSGRERIPSFMKPDLKHTHHALDDAIEQAMIFSKLFI